MNRKLAITITVLAMVALAVPAQAIRISEIQVGSSYLPGDWAPDNFVIENPKTAPYVFKTWEGLYIKFTAVPENLADIQVANWDFICELRLGDTLVVPAETFQQKPGGLINWGHLSGYFTQQGAHPAGYYTARITMKGDGVILKTQDVNVGYAFGWAVKIVGSQLGTDYRVSFNEPPKILDTHPTKNDFVTHLITAQIVGVYGVYFTDRWYDSTGTTQIRQVTSYHYEPNYSAWWRTFVNLNAGKFPAGTYVVKSWFRTQEYPGGPWSNLKRLPGDPANGTALPIADVP